MARRTNILSTILGGFGGGAEGGLAQRERSLAEQERRRAADAAERAERLGFLKAGFVPESSAGARDMPGATPRTPFATQEMPGGERVVMPDSPTQTAHREKVEGMVGDRRQAESTAARALAATQAEDERKVAALVAANVPEDEARARVIGGYTKPTPAASRLQMTPQGQVVNLDTGEARDVPGFRQAPRGSGTPAEAPEDAMLKAINQSVLQFSRTPQQGMPGLPPKMPTSEQVRAYRQMLLETMTGETESLDSAPPAARSFSGFPASQNPLGAPAAAAPARTAPAASAPTPAPPAALPSLGGAARNPLAGQGTLSAEEAQRLGVDFAQYQSNPGYRAYVDNLR